MPEPKVRLGSDGRSRTPRLTAAQREQSGLRSSFDAARATMDRIIGSYRMVRAEKWDRVKLSPRKNSTKHGFWRVPQPSHFCHVLSEATSSNMKILEKILDARNFLGSPGNDRGWLSLEWTSQHITAPTTMCFIVRLKTIWSVAHLWDPDAVVEDERTFSMFLQQAMKIGMRRNSACV